MAERSESVMGGTKGADDSGSVARPGEPGGGGVLGLDVLGAGGMDALSRSARGPVGMPFWKAGRAAAGGGGGRSSPRRPESLREFRSSSAEAKSVNIME